ncbi:S46 family peptidase [Croceimicrobium hydrocarbonivorans]|uniref:Dipeptidyl-peptidase n=1 Tax=Croceimicrobium hydrocarbonivorans TaxID=2761580 RepID=A0A7H0VA67_9FLAO|nr:S46 family peptidase [Croceimicrobium hydrocarbonivorans]QNR22615.1 S46 family peptidase [Croceimicrobium hydrocarbonivorans]
MKKLLSFTLALALALPAFANEGMWLPLLLGRNYEDMKAHGLQLTPEQIYDVNNGSLKDAIVSFGGFCTGEIISNEGLILTNHHCGYGQIQSHSSTEHDYLTDGFWAYEKSQELANEGLFVRFLVRMEDVTNRVLNELNDDMSEEERAKAISEIGKTISDEATDGTHYDANVRSFFHGNEFYLFVYETFNDIRLVGAPPSSVGKYGGDTDNWMWPRHTGDFSMFRVYADKDGKPAQYSEDNVPLTPKHFLPVNISGVQDGDYTMVMGYPGSTDRYLTSWGVKEQIDLYGPAVVRVRDLKLAVMKRYMEQDAATRIQYASKYARVSNYWKYYIGQTEQLQSNHVYDKKKAIEDKFAKWVSADAKRKAKYGEVLKMFAEAYAETNKTVRAGVYAREAGITGPEIALQGLRFGRTMQSYFNAAKAMEETEDEDTKAEMKTSMENIINSLKANADEFYKDYNAKLDQDLTANMLSLYYKDIPADQQPEMLKELGKKYKGDFGKYAAKLFDKSVLASKESLLEYLEDPKAKTLKKDMGIALGEGMYAAYQASNDNGDVDDKLEKAYRLFTAGLREMNSDKNYYPDANSTMRLTYGTVGSYDPRDAVHYNHYTTAEGIMEKKNNDDPEFVVPAHLEELIKAKDYGRYANEDGELPVCFIHNTDITGGNSGSPVINARGELIGTAFDGNWEAMSGDINFESEIQRTISVDVRYTLFIIEKYAGAKNLIAEMKIITEPVADSDAMTMEEDSSKEEPKKAAKM